MTAKIENLIDKQDNFEIIRDIIGLIIAEESANQQALASAGGKDPEEWKLRVYTERSHPFDQFLNDTPDSRVDDSPIVNVWYDSSSFELSSSGAIDNQHSTVAYNIDVYGFGRAQADGSGGHLSGDAQAAKKSQQGARLVRNIIMAAHHNRLGQDYINKVVSSRYIQTITAFQPQMGSLPVQNVTGVRLRLVVRMWERSPQYDAVDLEKVSVMIARDIDGKIIVDNEYVYQP